MQILKKTPIARPLYIRCLFGSRLWLIFCLSSRNYVFNDVNSTKCIYRNRNGFDHVRALNSKTTETKQTKFILRILSDITIFIPPSAFYTHYHRSSPHEICCFLLDIMVLLMVIAFLREVINAHGTIRLQRPCGLRQLHDVSYTNAQKLSVTLKM